MEKYQLAARKYIKLNGYHQNEHLLGIVLYGSYTTGYANANSDVDLHIIMDDTIKENLRGATVINGFKIEFFVKPISELYLGANIEFHNQSNALVPIIGRGKILYDKDNAVKNLQEYIMLLYSNPLPPMLRDEAFEQLSIAHTMMQRLEQSLLFNAIDFNSGYYLLAEKLRKIYHRMLGCAEIPPAKVVRIYSDEKYREAFCKTKLPDEEFIQKYFIILAFEGSREQKMLLIQDLFNYIIQGLDFDPNNYRVQIKSRYSLLSAAHRE